MEKLTDEELDSVFKNAAEGNAPPYDAAAWDALAQKLKAPRPVPLWKKWSPFILVGTVLFLGGVWVGRTSGEKDQPRLVEKQDQQSIPSNIPNKPLQNQELKSSELLAGESELDEELFNTKDDKTISRDLRIQQLKQRSISFSNSIIKDESSEAFDMVVEPDVQLFTNQEHEIFLEPIIQHELKADSGLLKSEVAIDSTEISEELADKPSGRRVYGLFIRLLASPDLSSIKFGPAELGSNFGVVGEFSLSEKFTLSTGVIRARKNYESYQEEAYGNSARHLVGNCTILDVPLNVTYNFPSKRKLSGYVTAGASSYLMLREDYIYTIKSNSGDRVYPYEAIRKNNEWFKVLNLAFGVQYKLAPRWQIQLEPFIKAPLADLGERNVRLSSMGIFTGLRYQLHSKTKHP